MDLKNNNLSGSLPSSMGSLSFLQSLHLRKNNLSGVLPPSLQNCSSLLALDLGENKFEGNIPNWIGERLSRIMILGLCSNDFQGDIPHELCDLGSLTILDLAHNNLSGNIPECFNNFSSMASVRNSSDLISYSFGHFKNSIETTLVVIKGILLEYSTTLPSKYFKVDVLELLEPGLQQFNGENSINLAYNNLTGKIPSSTQLQSFAASNFAGNTLCGPPLTDNCSINAVEPDAGGGNSEGSEDGLEVDWFWFYVSMALGFVVAFWSFAGPLLFKKSWRSAYFSESKEAE